MPLDNSRTDEITLTFSHVTEKFTPFGPLADEMSCHDDSMPLQTLPDSSATARFRKEADSSFLKNSHDLNSSYDASLSTGQKQSMEMSHASESSGSEQGLSSLNVSIEEIGKSRIPMDSTRHMNIDEYREFSV